MKPSTSKSCIYNGSGQLIYRGAVMGYTQPIAKAQRRGLQDFEYFWLLAQKSGREKADALVDRIVYKRPFGKQAMFDTEIWKNNPEEWDRARNADPTFLRRTFSRGSPRSRSPCERV